MSTPTCSAFFPRNCLASFMGGKYLLAANGPFVELFDMDKARSGKYNTIKDVPVRTQVTKNSTIYHILPLEKSEHVVVITSDTRNECRTLTARLVHSQTILNGGYAMDLSGSYKLSDEVDLGSCCETRAAVIPATDEIVLATRTFIARYSFSFSSTADLLEAKIIEEEKCDLSSVVTNGPKGELVVTPCCVSPSTPLNVLMRAYNEDTKEHSIIFVHTADPSLTARKLRIDGISKAEILLPNLNIGIVCGNEFISLVSASSHQEGVKKNQLKELHRIQNCSHRIQQMVPRRIFVKEEARTLLIFIVSEEETSLYEWDGSRMMEIREEPVTLKNGFDMLLDIKRLDGFEDLAVINNEDTCAIAVSRATGLFKITIQTMKESGYFSLFLSETCSLNMCTRLETICSPRPTDVYVLSHKHDGFHFSSNIVTLSSFGVEAMEINNQGTICPLWKESKQASAFHVTCSDVKFDQQSNTAHLLTGRKASEIHNVRLQILTQMNTMSETLVHAEDSKICSVRFFHDQFSGLAPDHFTVLTSTKLRVICAQCNSDKQSDTKIIYEIEFSKPVEWSDYNMITMGDGRRVHDVWLLSDKRAQLFIGRDQKQKKTVERKFDKWSGPITASCAISTKKGPNDPEYLDIVTVAKRYKIGLLVAIHMEDDPANVIQFVEWEMPPGSAIVGLHTELLKHETKNESHVFDIRLYAMKKKSGTLHISIGRFAVDGRGVTVSKALLNMYKIPTHVRNPHQIAVSNMARIETKPKIEPPKFVIVSGSNGSQVIRICPKKQLYSNALDHIVFPSSFDSDLISDVEDIEE